MEDDIGNCIGGLGKFLECIWNVYSNVLRISEEVCTMYMIFVYVVFRVTPYPNLFWMLNLDVEFDKKYSKFKFKRKGVFFS